MSINSLVARQRAQSTVSLRRRIVRANSEQRGSELKKSSTMTSFRPKLQRLIQEGKIEQIMNADPSSKAHLFYTNHVNELEKELASSKKSLGTYVTRCRGKEQSINAIKNELRKVEREIQIIRQQASLASKRFSLTNDGLNTRRAEQQQVYWTEKSSEHVKARSYADEVLLKGRSQQLQREWDIQGQNKKLLEQKYLELKQLNRQLLVMRNEAKSISDQQARDKTEYISLLATDMSERAMLGQLKAEKHRREGEINAIAPSLIEQQQLANILKVLHAHRVLSQILHVKSNHLLGKYADVSTAYNYIRSNANIVEPDRILKRMQEHDSAYDEALKRVAALEAQLASLQTSFQNRLLTKQKILSKQGVAPQYAKGYYQGLQKDKYELLVSEKDKLKDRNKQDEVLRKNILSWSSRMFAQYRISHTQNISFFDCLTDLVVRIRQQKHQ